MDQRSATGTDTFAEDTYFVPNRSRKSGIDEIESLTEAAKEAIVRGLPVLARCRYGHAAFSPSQLVRTLHAK
jgi:hypothetical protein